MLRLRSRTSLVLVSVLVAGFSAAACGEENKDKSADEKTRMKAGSCSERLASKKILFKDLDCENDKEDPDCKELALAIKELEEQCGEDKTGN